MSDLLTTPASARFSRPPRMNAANPRSAMPRRTSPCSNGFVGSRRRSSTSKASLMADCSAAASHPSQPAAPGRKRAACSALVRARSSQRDSNARTNAADDSPSLSQSARVDIRLTFKHAEFRLDYYKFCKRTALLKAVLPVKPFDTNEFKYFEFSCRRRRSFAQDVQPLEAPLLPRLRVHWLRYAAAHKYCHRFRGR